MGSRAGPHSYLSDVKAELHFLSCGAFGLGGTTGSSHRCHMLRVSSFIVFLSSPVALAQNIGPLRVVSETPKLYFLFNSFFLSFYPLPLARRSI
jgi:hypothetical protein